MIYLLYGKNDYLIKEFIKKYKYTDVILIILIMFIFSFLFSNHFSSILPDYGRELLLPKEILNGAIPYKNINLIFFPLAYYINATIYKF